MPDILPALSVIAVSLAAANLYGLVWYATRGLGRMPRALARAVPVAAILPGLYMLSLALSPPLRPAEASPAGMARSARPAAAAPPAVRRPMVPAPATGDVAAIGGGSADPDAYWDVVPILYGTDRARQDDATRLAYGPERARRLELGRAIVTVPAAHRVPTIERPFAVRVPYFQVVLYEQAEDPRSHFTIKELKDV